MPETKTETLPYDGIDDALAKLAKDGWVQVGRSFNENPECCDVRLERSEKPKVVRAPVPKKQAAKSKAKGKKA